jgi:phosphoribosylanthranilate isomerase
MAGTFVKICGLTRREDARLAADLGASALGFVFWPRSPRYVDPRDVRAILAGVPGVMAVGVFVDQPLDEVRGIARDLDLDAVQLHGTESAEYCLAVGRPVIKAATVESSDGSSVRDVPADALLLLDAHDPLRRGGTGRTIDWDAAAEMARRRPVILSGGLRPDNVSDAISRVRPYAVDVSSGVERHPGEKDPDKLRAFVAAVGAIAPGPLRFGAQHAAPMRHDRS